MPGSRFSVVFVFFLVLASRAYLHVCLPCTLTSSSYCFLRLSFPFSLFFSHFPKHKIWMARLLSFLPLLYGIDRCLALCFSPDTQAPDIHPPQKFGGSPEPLSFLVLLIFSFSLAAQCSLLLFLGHSSFLAIGPAHA